MLRVIETKKEWNEVIKKFKNLDIYYSYEYCKQFSEIEEGHPLAVYYEDENGFLFYSFILRKIPCELSNNMIFFDIITPYGYGGPIIEGNPKIIKNFRVAFEFFCKSRNIVTELVCFHPLENNYVIDKMGMNIEFIRKTVAIDLTDSIEEVRKNYSKSVRRKIKKAKKYNVKCYEVEKTVENLSIFKSMYDETMKRRNAKDFYYFDNNFYKRQLTNTPLCTAKLIFAEKDNKVIAGSMSLIGKSYAHSFLSASLKQYHKFHPNELVLDYEVQIAKKNNCKLIHLGGGYKDLDGLFQFKASFSKKIFNYYIGKKIYNQKIYEQLVGSMSRDYILDRYYFPLYRGTLRKRNGNKVTEIVNSI